MSGLEVENINAELGLQGIFEIDKIFGWTGNAELGLRGIFEIDRFWMHRIKCRTGINGI
jgi:hypothetical protein